MDILENYKRSHKKIAASIESSYSDLSFGRLGEKCFKRVILTNCNILTKVFNRGKVAKGLSTVSVMYSINLVIMLITPLLC